MEKPKGEDSTLNFDDIAKQTTVVADDDPPVLKLGSKVEEFQYFIFPLLILFPLNLNTGTAFAFLIVDFFFIMAAIILFNLMKVHLSCCENKCIRVILENLWIILLFFMTVNQWGATPIMQPYILTEG